MTSIGSKEHVYGGFNPTFTIQGKLYYRMGNLLPEGGETPKFSQIYFFDSDTDAKLNYRLTHAELDSHILQELESTLHSVNSYVKPSKTAIEVGVEKSDVKLVLHADKKHLKADMRELTTYQPPAKLLLFFSGDATGNLNIIVRFGEGDGQELRRISTCHRS